MSTHYDNQGMKGKNIYTDRMFQGFFGRPSFGGVGLQTAEDEVLGGRGDGEAFGELDILLRVVEEVLTGEMCEGESTGEEDEGDDADCPDIDGFPVR
jgi:hypothetical protein